jgi:lauroyl/myristoyl acyltransferase
LPDVVDVRGGEALLAARERGPVVVVSWHSGIGEAVLAALHRLGQSGVLVRRRPGPSILGFAPLESGGTRLRDTSAFMGALKHAQAGGLVVLFIDTLPANSTAFDRSMVFLDRLVELPRGPAALERLAGASIFCVDANWADGGGSPFLSRLEPLAPPPISRPALSGGDEGVSMEHLARHFETRLRDRPGELWPVSLRSLASAPRSPDPPPRCDA